MRTKVYILGAGASYPDGVPVMSEFIRQGIIQLGESAIIKELRNFVKRKFELDILNDQTLREFEDKRGIEEVLSEAVKEGGKVENLIKKFIFETIEEASIRPSFSVPGRCGSEHFETVYHQFVSRRIKEDMKGNNVVLISFNYDQLLQRALLHHCLSNKFSYCMPLFEKENNRINFRGYMSEYEGRIKVLNLHGALNWVFCRGCRDIKLYWHKKYKNVYDDPCKECGKKCLSPLLIPPVKNKKYGDIIQPLWVEAKACLEKAAEIIVIGYSFPEIDIEARKMVMDALKNNSSLLALTVVDKIPDKILGKIKIQDTNNSPNKKEVFKCFKDFINNERGEYAFI